MPEREDLLRLSMLEAVEGHYASEALLSLLRLGVLEALARPRNARTLAKAANVDSFFLTSILEFVRRTTDIVDRDRTGRYRLGRHSLPEIIFQLEKFIGAYGAGVRGLTETLRSAQPGSRPDEKALSAAFSAVSSVRSVEAELFREMDVRHLLDLGCGPGSLLIELSLANHAFRGIGVDSSVVMCRTARSRVRSAGLQSHIRIFRADARCMERVLSPRDLRAIDVVHGRSLLNALFGRGDSHAVAFLRKLRNLLPGRLGLFVDYYGELGRKLPNKHQFRLAQVQDLAQLGSGQGIPPSDRKGWDSVFRQAGCQLVSLVDVRDNDIRWFIRQVRF